MLDAVRSGIPLARIAVALACAGLLASCSALVGLKPTKVDTSQVRDWLVVPVFYSTNRARSSAVPDIDYEESSSETGPSYGVDNAVIPLLEGMEISQETMKKMSWQLIHLNEPLPNGTKPPLPVPCKVPDRSMTAEEVVREFERYTKTAGSKEVVFFVHGCCATFKTSTERAAKIAAHMQIPLVVYDWVSPKGFSRYLENETLAEQTLDDFYAFLNGVEKLLPAEATTLIGHSMGAQFLDAALVRRFERTRCGAGLPKYKEVVMSNADTDAKSFINHNSQFAANAEKTRLYVSSDDDRLKTSALAHGGFPRLGCPGALMPDLCRTPNQDVIDVYAVGMGHELPFWVVANMHRYGTPGRTDRFRLVDRGPHLSILERVAVNKNGD